MIHLIGLAHEAQASPIGEPETEAQKRYAYLLGNTIITTRPCIVAEEYSGEAERMNKVRSIAWQVAAALNTEHRFCDPTKAERKQIGYVGTQELHLAISMHDRDWDISNEEAEAKAWAICIGRYFAIRERFWLSKIHDVVKEEILFVLGDGHVDSFTLVVAGEGLNSRVVARGIGVTAQHTARMENGMRYLREHPECVNEDVQL